MNGKLIQIYHPTFYFIFRGHFIVEDKAYHVVPRGNKLSTKHYVYSESEEYFGHCGNAGKACFVICNSHWWT